VPISRRKRAAASAAINAAPQKTLRLSEPRESAAAERDIWGHIK
jgi:hypothetical protein